VDWVLALAPIGVFALTLPLATQMGVALVGALGYYVVIVSATSLVLALALYPVVALTTGVTIRQFARAAAPAQAVAFSASSSLASLPALIEGAESRLVLPSAITGFALPLAVSMFKFVSPVATLTAVFVTSRLYGVAIAPAQLIPTVAVAALITIGTPGIPGGGLLAGVPVFVTAGLPAEAIGFFLAVDAIADRFRAPANATADLAAATFLARHLHSPRQQPAPLEREVAPQF
jgi:Na+/H+-dicarboxylate symporter